jgi:NitT/TauT family transport system substrate-binding protein
MKLKRLIMKMGAALALVGTIGVQGATPAYAADQATLRLNWYLYGFAAPWLLGKELGFFRDEGIDLVINEGRGSANTVQVIAGGSDTFGVADSASVMLLAAKGAEIKSIMTVMSTSGFGVISLNGNPIRKPKDLEGKTVAITAGDSLTQLFPAVIKASNLDAKKISQVQIDPAGKIVALLEKRVDAILGSVDDQFFLIRERGFTPEKITFADNGVNTIGLTVVASDATIAKNPDLVRRFVKAATRSFNAAKANPDQAIAALLKIKPELNPQTQKDQLLMGFSLMDSPASKGRPIGFGATSDWDTTMQLMKQYRGLTTSKPATAFYTNSFLPN